MRYSRNAITAMGIKRIAEYPTLDSGSQYWNGLSTI